MAVVNACLLPEDLHYDVDRGIWLRFDPDGTAVTGFTDPFQTRAGKLLVVQPRPLAAGRIIPRGRAAATVESAKWVGAFSMILTAEVVAFNEAVLRSPSLVNKDPYGAGWVARVRPAALAEERAHLLTGGAAVQAYGEKLARDRVHCIRCAE